MKRFIALIIWFGVLAASAHATLIPATRLKTYTPGTNLGVDGGIEQYLAGSGQLKERPNSGPNFINAVSNTHSNCDNTLTTDTGAAIQALISAVGGDEVVLYFPIGGYKWSSTVSTHFFNRNFTIRGATFNGENHVQSVTSNAVGTGTKTFTVPAGVGWTAGVGVCIIDRFDERNWMIGTVTSYSGTTLVANITQSHGSGTKTDWAVSLTFFDHEGSNIALEIGVNISTSMFTGDVNVLEDNTETYVHYFTAPNNAGTSTITLTSAAGISVGSMIRLLIDDNQDAASILAGTEDLVIAWQGSGVGNGNGIQGSMRSMVSRVAAVSGNTITLDTPLLFNCPMRLHPRVAWNDERPMYGVGIEHIWMIGSSGETQKSFRFNIADNCWMYDVWSLYVRNYATELYLAYKCQLQRCRFAGRNPTYSGSSGAALLVNSGSHCLVANNGFYRNFPGTEVNSGTVGCAFVYGYYAGNDGTLGNTCLINGNHGPHNSFNLYEGNLAPMIQFDGYFGSASRDTIFRNWLFGVPEIGLFGFVAITRGNWNMNVVGNMQGDPGVIKGLMSFGNAYMGGGASAGDISPFVAGTWWKHFPAEPMRAVVTNSGTGAVTLQNAVVSDLADSTFLQTPNRCARWYGSSGLFGFDISGSGTALTITGGSGSLPANGTTIYIYTGTYGFKEQDGGVQETVIEKGNFLLGTGGTGGAMSSLGGDPIPDSLVYPSRPVWFPTSQTYPWVVASAPAWDREQLPAYYRYIHDVDAPDSNTTQSPSFSPIAGTHTGTQSVTITSSTSGATIRYTVDGTTTPTSSVGTIYSGAVTVSSSLTLKAIAYKSGLSDSSVTTGAYVILPPVSGTGNETVIGSLNVTGTLKFP